MMSGAGASGTGASEMPRATTVAMHSWDFRGATAKATMAAAQAMATMARAAAGTEAAVVVEVMALLPARLPMTVGRAGTFSAAAAREVAPVASPTLSMAPVAAAPAAPVVMTVTSRPCRPTAPR